MAAAVSKGAGGWRVGAVRRRRRRPCAQPASRRALASGASAADAARARGRGHQPEAELGGSTEYKRHLATVMVRRALEAAGA